MTIEEANEPFAKGLEKIIKEKGLKQCVVAKKAGFSKQQLSDMLNGRRLIRACDIPELAIVLNVKVDDIYKAGRHDESYSIPEIE